MRGRCHKCRCQTGTASYPTRGPTCPASSDDLFGGGGGYRTPGPRLMSPLLYQLSYTATPSLRLIMPQKLCLPAFGAHLACVVSDEGAQQLLHLGRCLILGGGGLHGRGRRRFLGGKRRAGLHPGHNVVEGASHDARFLLGGPHHSEAVEALDGPWPHLDLFVFAQFV